MQKYQTKKILHCPLQLRYFWFEMCNFLLLVIFLDENWFFLPLNGVNSFFYWIMILELKYFSYGLY